MNAVYAKKIAAVPEDEEEYVAQLQAEYATDVDIVKLASELIVDAIIPGQRLRAELIERFAFYSKGIRFQPIVSMVSHPSRASRRTIDMGADLEVL